jgi:hypothetical protein
MSNLILNDNVIGGSSNDSSDILYTPNDNRAETNVQDELDRINTGMSIKDITQQCSFLGSCQRSTAVQYGNIILITLVVDSAITSPSDYYVIFSLPSGYNIINKRIPYHSNANDFCDLICGDNSIKFRSAGAILKIGTGNIMLLVE